MQEHPFGWLSIVPPVVAIAAAIISRRVLVSLLIGIFTGALITHQWNVLGAMYDTVAVHLWQPLAGLTQLPILLMNQLGVHIGKTDPDVDYSKLQVAAFTLLMGSMVGLIGRSGGMRGLVDVLSHWANTPRKGQVGIGGLGLLIFFDDYANTLLLGSTLRPLVDRLRISREKLAYLVDSTAAPVAGLALVSTWVATELSYVQDGIANLPQTAGGPKLDAFEIFVASIPYRFYSLFAIAFVFLIAATGRDYGAMRTAELKQADPLENNLDSKHPWYVTVTQPREGVVGRWFDALIPIVVTVAVIVYWMYRTGTESVVSSGENRTPSLLQIFGSADPFMSLVWGSIAGLLIALALGVARRTITLAEAGWASLGGARMMVPALLILWFASALSGITNSPSGDESEPYAQQHQHLYTGDYLSSLLVPAVETSGDSQAPSPQTAKPTVGLWLLPTVVFLLAAFVSFATGSSWGTMGILVPVVIPATVSLMQAEGVNLSPDHPLLLGSLGSVLAGAIFGDHCSPISDTTVLSSQASGCDHIAHVRTQLPYAVTVAAVSIVCGTLPLGFGLPVWLLLPLAFVGLVATVFLLGRPQPK